MKETYLYGRRVESILREWSNGRSARKPTRKTHNVRRLYLVVAGGGSRGVGEVEEWGKKKGGGRRGVGEREGGGTSGEGE